MSTITNIYKENVSLYPTGNLCNTGNNNSVTKRVATSRSLFGSVPAGVTLDQSQKERLNKI